MLLMGVGASLTLFNGAHALCRRIRADIRALWFTASLGCAPTARGACSWPGTATRARFGCVPWSDIWTGSLPASCGRLLNWKRLLRLRRHASLQWNSRGDFRGGEKKERRHLASLSNIVQCYFEVSG